MAGGPTLIAGAACLVLIASAIWAHYRFAEYDRLPRQFGFTLKPTAYGPPWLVIWLTPAIMIATLALIVFLPVIVPPEGINGDPETGVVIACAAMVSAQVFILWLLTRWANGQ